MSIDISEALAAASMHVRSLGMTTLADHLLAKSDAAFDAAFESTLNEFAPVATGPDGSPRIAHAPVVTAPDEWPGCNGVMRAYPSGDLACDAGCVVLPAAELDMTPNPDPHPATVGHHDVEARGLTKETN